jgi:Dolichyl-phosphate-mannose-protein mannosyltransferase
MMDVPNQRSGFRPFTRVWASHASNGRRDCGAILVVALVIAIVLRPFQNTPFIDDWVYSWSVQHLLDTGTFLFPEYIGNPILTQVLWAALFCMPFGFSLAALRLSTWVLAVLAVCGLYLLVVEAGGTRRAALVSAAILGFYPVFFILSPTFMTDVPFLAAMLWSTLLFVKALARRSDLLIWLASALCAASVGCRIIGVGLAAAMIATLLFHTGRWGRRVNVLLPPALVGLFAGWLLVWTRQHVFRSADVSWLPNSPQQRLANLRYAIDFLPTSLVVTLLFVVMLVGIALLPIAVGVLHRALLRRAAMFILLLTAAWFAAKRFGLGLWVPLEPGELWALREIGATASFVPGWKPDPLPFWVTAAVVTLALGSAGTLTAAWPGRGLREADMFLLWHVAMHVLFVAVLWLTYDRCGLVFVPLAAALLLSREVQLSIGRTIPCITMYALISLAGARDHLEYNGAVWSAVSDLRARGVRPADIDGGYVVNGWLQYLHPEDAYRDASGRIIVPMVNDVADLPYTVADRPRSDRTVVRTYPYSGWLRPSGQIYVLQR